MNPIKQHKKLLKTMTKAERIKLIQIGLQYVIPRLKQVENVEDEMPTNFQIEIIDRLSKKTDKELDEAIRDSVSSNIEVQK